LLAVDVGGSAQRCASDRRRPGRSQPGRIGPRGRAKNQEPTRSCRILSVLSATFMCKRTTAGACSCSGFVLGARSPPTVEQVRSLGGKSRATSRFCVVMIPCSGAWSVPPLPTLDSATPIRTACPATAVAAGTQIPAFRGQRAVFPPGTLLGQPSSVDTGRREEKEIRKGAHHVAKRIRLEGIDRRSHGRIHRQYRGCVHRGSGLDSPLSRCRYRDMAPGTQGARLPHVTSRSTGGGTALREYDARPGEKLPRRRHGIAGFQAA
jgi:hypothetical protein